MAVVTTYYVIQDPLGLTAQVLQRRDTNTSADGTVNALIIAIAHVQDSLLQQATSTQVQQLFNDMHDEEETA